MEIGVQTITLAEEMVLRIRPQLMSSHRIELDVGRWNYNICSPFWRLYVNRQAGAFIDCGGQRYRLQPDQLWVVPSWVGFRTGIEARVVHDFIHFDLPALVPNMVRRWFDHPVQLEDREPLRTLCKLWGEALDAREAAPVMNYAWARALMDAVIATMLGGMEQGSRRQCLSWLDAAGGMAPAMAAIERRLSDPPTNAELAALCGLSTGYFVRRFAAEVGQTPARYSLERRLIAAATALSEGETRIDEIAEACGFPDRYYFSRAFKAKMGVSPAAYRRMHRAGQ
jgi:AraC-like DNA-binding protein